MRGKTIGVLIVGVDEGNPNVTFLTTRLRALHWRVQPSKTLPQDTLVLTDAIEKSVKHTCISVLLGEYTDDVAQSLSNVFYQKLTTVEFGQIPMYARFVDYPNDTVLYVQGLLVIPITCNVPRIYESYIKRFIVNAGADYASSNAVSNGETAPICSRSLYEFGREVDTICGFSRYEHVRRALENIEKCLTKYHPDNVFISFNGGKDCTVLLHMTLAVLKRNYPEYPKGPLCLYIENMDTFKEISDFVEECEAYYNLEILKIKKNTQDALTFILDDRPLLKACLMGTRRTDPFSEYLEIFQMTDPDWPQVMRVSPLLDWHYSQIWDYLLTLKVPYCKLYDIGYTSLGNVSNTSKNPLLRCNEETYLPAYKLLDASQERQGRDGQSNKVKTS